MSTNTASINTIKNLQLYVRPPSPFNEGISLAAILEYICFHEGLYDKYGNHDPIIINADGFPTGLCEFRLKGGSILKFNTNAEWELIHDADGIYYKPCEMREFNTYVNASDRLEEFVEFAGKQNITKEEFLNLPIKHFITWLILEAAKADGEDNTENEILPLKENNTKCLYCGKFLSFKKKQMKIQFCNGEHMDAYEEKHR